jgi:RND family efflux transporter MFP subunit
MTAPSFLKKKSTYILGVIILLIVGGYFLTRGKGNAPVYELAPVVQQDLGQTVEVSGELKPATRIDLAFQGSGTIDAINVKVGDTVKKGDLLATLKNDDILYAAKNAKAALAIAQANLDARLAGETKQSIAIAETQVEQAQASYDKAVSDLASTQQTTADNLNSASIALETAKHNLDNSGATVSQNVTNAYDSARTSLLTALGPLQTGLTDGDNIIGVDNSAANQSYVNVLGFLDSSSIPNAKNAYADAKTAKTAAESAVRLLNSNSTKSDIQDAATKVQTAITLVQTYLTDVQKVLAASLTSSNLTSTDLASKKSTIDADRTSVSAQNSTVLTALQSVKGSELTQTQTVQQLQDAYNTAQSAYNVAKTNADTQVRAAKSNVSIQKAALDAARAGLDLKKSPPRAVDVQSLRASVLQASANADKAQSDLQNIEIISPEDGIISEIIPTIGEQVTMNTPQIRMITTQTFDIQASVPEADISKVKVGQKTTITLDAYGDEVKFNGTVTAENPDQTKIQDAVYYIVHVQIDPSGHDVKPGMTANITIDTADRKNVLVMPLRGVLTTADGKKTVRVLINKQPVTREVTLGLHGDNGQVEVLSGVAVGEQVIVGQTGGTTP